MKYFSQSYKTKRGAEVRADFENKRQRPDVNQYHYSAARDELTKGWKVERSVVPGYKTTLKES